MSQAQLKDPKSATLANLLGINRVYECSAASNQVYVFANNSLLPSNYKRDGGISVPIYNNLSKFLPFDSALFKSYQSRFSTAQPSPEILSVFGSCLNDSRISDIVSMERRFYDRMNQPKIEVLIATISCGMGTNNHINVQACFVGGRDGVPTELELTNGSQYGLYKSYNLSELGPEDDAGLNINLSGKYSIKVQNSSKNLTLTLTVRDAGGGIRFQRSVGQYGVIRTGN
jgi:hypothetical protein